MTETVNLQSLIILAVVAVAIFLLGGGLAAIIDPRNVPGSLAAITLYAYGLIGLMLMYKSALQYRLKPKQACKLLLEGAATIIVVYVCFEVLIG
jgi:hypothetical protein